RNSMSNSTRDSMTTLKHNSQGNRPSPFRFLVFLIALLGTSVCKELSETGEISRGEIVRGREGD
ncbi:MAG: hypothetical protein WCF26_02250, partial [Candidatus Sulfotelmatobacter sp.]